ncbi:MFS transporter [Cellulosimicrobium sp. PMB13]|uniref:MFS transporter n=1 Tax=Cellulosimicrobium sp. PMB13 TaxID=3120158 RepID=UPI003F4B52BF
MTRSALPAPPTQTPAAGPSPSDGRRGALERTGAYARLPRLAGPWFLPVAFLARLPFSMLTIGTLLLVTQTTGSVGQGGLASAATALGTAVGGPTQGALADRVGQRRVVLVCAPLAGLAVLALLAATAGPTGPAAAVLGAAALVGASVPQVGPLARVRWIALTADEPRTLSAAMSYESTADEVSFVLGPALVGVLAALGSPRTAMLAAAALVVVAGTAFALHPTARARTGTNRPQAARSTRPTGPRAALRLVRVEAVAVVGMVAMGLVFGGTQAALTALTRDVGSPDLAGLVYAVLGVGSAITALAVVALPDRWSQAGRWTTFSGGLLVSALALLGAASTGSLPLVVAAVAVAGLFVGPVMVTVFTVAGRRAPAGRTAAAMTLVASANVVGVALGATSAGLLAESASTTAAFAVPVVAATLLLAAGMSLTSRPRAGRRAGTSAAAAVR